MKKLIIILAILFSYNAYSQTHLPGVDMKVVYEGTITFPANADTIKIYHTKASATHAIARDSSIVTLAASVYADWITAGDLDTIGRYDAVDSLYYFYLLVEGMTGISNALRYVNTAGTIAWFNFDKGPFPLLSEKLIFMGEIISSTVANPKVGLISKYWWVAPSTNASDNTDFIDMNDALSHDLSDDRAQLDTISTAPLWLYGKVYGVFMHWGSEAKTIKYKLWMARIDRRW